MKDPIKPGFAWPILLVVGGLVLTIAWLLVVITGVAYGTIALLF